MYWHPPNLAVFGGRDRIAAHNDFLAGRINIRPSDQDRLCFNPHSAKRKEFNQIPKPLAPCTAFGSDVGHQIFEL